MMLFQLNPIFRFVIPFHGSGSFCRFADWAFARSIASTSRFLSSHADFLLVTSPFFSVSFFLPLFCISNKSNPLFQKQQPVQPPTAVLPSASLSSDVVPKTQAGKR